MPYDLEISQTYSSAGWKAKIRDKERLEPPHVTIMKGTKSWRLDLRSGEFMDDDPPPRDVPKDLLAKVQQNMGKLREEWDKMYPTNPVGNNNG